ncbi:MAG: cytochrome c3 family protein [Gammaproteobacteria bacterium]
MKYRLAAIAMCMVSALLLLSCAEGIVSGTRSANYVVEGGGTGAGKKWVDNRFFATQVKTEKLTEDGIHDPKNDAIKALQEPSEAMSAFPLDRRGGVDWVKAINLGIINPRADLKGEQEMVVMDMDIMFKDTGNMPWVRFPHKAHTQWLACENCHPAIFLPQKGASNPSMDGILAGEYCGRCHDKVAFALWICERCHSVPHENSPPKWWD